MFVPCPHCQFLVAHHPQLRPLPADCPRCGRPLSDVEDTAGTAPGEDAEALAPAGSARLASASLLHEPAVAGAPEQDADTGRVAVEVAPVDAAPAASTAPPSSIARPSTPGHGMQRWQWPLVAALGVVLALQILLADRDRLAADPRWRPLMENVCGVLRCSLAPWHEPAAFSMLDRKVRPESAGALRVDATFRNDARWAQPWPALQLALADADGRTLGSQVFAPEQYLGHAPDALLSPGQSAHVTFVVQEPAPGTVAFSFQFH